jgi:hypothetical protein
MRKSYVCSKDWKQRRNGLWSMSPERIVARARLTARPRIACTDFTVRGTGLPPCNLPYIFLDLPPHLGHGRRTRTRGGAGQGTPRPRYRLRANGGWRGMRHIPFPPSCRDHLLRRAATHTSATALLPAPRTPWQLLIINIADGCTVNASFDPNDSDQQAGIQNVPDCGPNTTDPTFQLVCSSFPYSFLFRFYFGFGINNQAAKVASPPFSANRA